MDSTKMVAGSSALHSAGADALAAVLEHMPESVGIYELDSTVCYVNPATERIFGRSLSSMQGRRLFDIFPEALGNPFHQAFERVAAGGAPEVFDHYYPPFDAWFANRVAKVGHRVHVIARDVTEEVRRRRRLETLARISEVLSDDGLDLPGAARGLARILVDTMHAECSIFLLSRDREWLELAAAASEDPEAQKLTSSLGRIPSDTGHLGEALRTRRPVLAQAESVGAAAAEVADAELRGVVARYDPSSVIVVPLLVGDDTIGALLASRRRGERPLTEDDRVLAEAIAPGVALYVAHARRRDEAASLRNAESRLLSLERQQRELERQTTRRLESLLELAGKLARAARPDEIARVLVDRGGDALQASMAALFTLSDDGRELVLARERGFGPEYRRVFGRVPLTSGGPMVDVIASGRPAWIASRADYATRYPEMEATHRPPNPPPLALAFLPLILDGTPVGCLSFIFHDEQRLTDSDRAYLEVLASHGGEALRRARLYSELRDVSETREAMIRASPAAILLLDDSGVVHAWNPAAEHIFGWSAAEVVGKPHPALGEQRQELLASVAHVLAGNSIQGRETRHRRASGDWFDVELYAAPVALSDGRTLCLAILADITERKRAERGRQLVADASATLARSLDLRETLRDVVQLPLAGVADFCAIDVVLDGAVERVASTMHGSEADPSPAPDTQPLGAASARRAVEAGEIWLAGNLDQRSRELGDAELVAFRMLGMRSVLTVPLAAGGARVGALCLASRSRNFDGVDVALATELGRYMATSVENARLFQEAKRSHQEAEAASRAKDEFLAMLGHELRNPLAPMATALELMRMREPERLVREREVVTRHLAHVSRLVDDLLDVSRITRGMVELRRENVPLATIVAKALESVSPLLEERRPRVSIEVPSDLVVRVDPTRLEQVVVNLLSNAAKYTQPQGHIMVCASQHEGSISLSVRDDGVGIASEMLPRIFDLFFQAPQSRARAEGGLGLGLAIVQNLVKAHGGHVVARSEGPGKGSEFVVTLPAASSRITTAPPPAAPRPARGGRRILVVDDNQDAADLLSDLLRAHGHELRTAYDGPSALKVAESFLPEIAVLDIGLPVMDGYELAERLRAMQASRPPRLIALTGYGQPSDCERARDAGFDAHLTKPVSLDALLPALS